MEEVKVTNIITPSELLRNYLFGIIGNIKSPENAEVSKGIIRVADFLTIIGSENEELYEEIIGLFYIDYYTPRVLDSSVKIIFDTEHNNVLDKVNDLEELIIVLDAAPELLNELLGSSLPIYIMSNFMNKEIPYVDDVHKRFNKHYELENSIMLMRYKLTFMDKYFESLNDIYTSLKTFETPEKVIDEIRNVLKDTKRTNNELYTAVSLEMLGTYILVAEAKAKLEIQESDAVCEFVNYHLNYESKTKYDLVEIFEHPYCQTKIIETYFDFLNNNSKEYLSIKENADYKTESYQKIRKLVTKKDQF